MPKAGNGRKMGCTTQSLSIKVEFEVLLNVFGCLGEKIRKEGRKNVVINICELVMFTYAKEKASFGIKPDFMDI